MKWIVSVTLLLAVLSAANGFVVLPLVKNSILKKSTTVELYLFGGKKDGSSDKKGPGFMDQMAMLKKAQEVAMKKMAMDKELSQLSFVGEGGAGGKIKATVKYIPPPPMQQPSYEGSAVDIDESFLQSSNVDDLGEAITEALSNAYQKAHAEVTTKMTEFAFQMQDMMKGMAA
jgi:DNA-binding protein YbaB